MAAVLKLSEDGSHQQVTEFRDGEIIGESSLLEDEKSKHRRSASIVAQTACNMVCINRKAMLDIITKYPDIQRQLQIIHDRRLSAFDNKNSQNET